MTGGRDLSVDERSVKSTRAVRTVVAGVNYMDVDRRILADFSFHRSRSAWASVGVKIIKEEHNRNS